MGGFLLEGADRRLFVVTNCYQRKIIQRRQATTVEKIILPNVRQWIAFELNVKQFSLYFTAQSCQGNCLLFESHFNFSVSCVGGESIGGDLCTRKWQRNGGMDVTVSFCSSRTMGHKLRVRRKGIHRFKLYLAVQGNYCKWTNGQVPSWQREICGDKVDFYFPSSFCPINGKGKFTL